eukprot:scaffold93064_cov104-Phaeocystis_antarctica.AAC.2
MRTTSGAQGVSKGSAERAALVLRAFASARNERWLFGIVKRLAKMLGHRQKALLCLLALCVKEHRVGGPLIYLRVKSARNAQAAWAAQWHLPALHAAQSTAAWLAAARPHPAYAGKQIVLGPVQIDARKPPFLLVVHAHVVA